MDFFVLIFFLRRLYTIISRTKVYDSTERESWEPNSTTGKELALHMFNPGLIPVSPTGLPSTTSIAGCGLKNVGGENCALSIMEGTFHHAPWVPTISDPAGMFWGFSAT